jgi:peptidoglycan/LPS O-acetylase OafA/YrhL
MKSEGALSNVHLNAARGAAALVVFAGHGRDFFLESYRSAIGLEASAQSQALISASHPPNVSFGHHAVIVFFVLSGYLVGGGGIRGVRQGTWSWKNYAWQRLTRLYVVLLPALILTFVLDHLGRYYSVPDSIYAHGHELLEIDGTTNLPTFLGNVFFAQSILVRTFGTNGPLWSLANEFWYYLMFPLVVLAILPDTAVSRILKVALLGIMIYFVGLQIALYFLIWLMGAALELLPRFSYSRAVRCGTCGTVFAFVAANVFFVKHPVNLIASDFILGALFSLCCYFFLQATERAPRNLYLIFSSVLAGMSYTLYLVHTPMLVFISAVYVGSWKRWPFDFLHISQFAIICLVTFAGAYGLYICFERNTEGVRAWARGVVRSGFEFRSS